MKNQFSFFLDMGKKYGILTRMNKINKKA